jgi:peptidoglycan hydrolase-like protein with peptidoglycan-binding domain
MRIQGKLLKKIIKEEIIRSTSGLIRESAGERAQIMLNMLGMSEDAQDALTVSDKLEDIISGDLVVKQGNKGPVVKVIQALVKGKLWQALGNKGAASFASEKGGALEIQRSLAALGEPDGIFGDNTKNAVMTLQKVQKADAFMKGATQDSPELTTIDGKVGRQTLSYLISGMQGASVSDTDLSPAPTTDFSEERKIPKSLLLAALDNPDTMRKISQMLNMSEEDVYNASLEVPDDVDAKTMPEWFSILSGGIKTLVDTDAQDMAELMVLLSQVHGTPVAGKSDVMGPKKGSYSRADAAGPMNESRDLTSRLMARWIK